MDTPQDDLGLTPEQLHQLMLLTTAEERKKQALQLGHSGVEHTTPGGTLVGGISDALGSLLGGFQANKIRGEQVRGRELDYKLMSDEDARTKAILDALRRGQQDSGLMSPQRVPDDSLPPGGGVYR